MRLVLALLLALLALLLALLALALLALALLTHVHRLRRESQLRLMAEWRQHYCWSAGWCCCVVYDFFSRWSNTVHRVRNLAKM